MEWSSGSGPGSPARRAGRVADLHSLLPHTKLKIVAEHFQRVEHCLVALPGATLKSIKTVKSHVQALAQCRNFLRKHRLAPLVQALSMRRPSGVGS